MFRHFTPNTVMCYNVHEPHQFFIFHFSSFIFNMHNFNYFPGGRTFAVTFSYDDGTAQDERLVGIFNKHKIRGTFHLNSANLTNGRGSHIQAAQVRELFAGHEVSCHTVTHPFPCEITRDRLAYETLHDRLNLEQITGGIVRGMSYPFGQFDGNVADIMRSCGIAYSRTTVPTGGFGIPKDFMEWRPTCHHKAAAEPVEKFLALVNGTTATWRQEMRLLYIWGHSYEFDNDDNWNLIEDLCAKLGGNGKIWYASNIAICDYINAVRAMRSSVDGRWLHNPSAVPVWVGNSKGEATQINPGEMKEC